MKPVSRVLPLLSLLIPIFCIGDESKNEELRYERAMKLLLPHLTWHAGELPPEEDRHRLEVLQDQNDGWGNRWEEAHRGEPWMIKHVPQPVIDAFRAKLKNRSSDLKEFADNPYFYWRLTDPDHPDIARAVKLLQSIDSREASGWVAELKRNNTVLTVDIPGGFVRGKKGPIILDSRNADEIEFKVYRVEDPLDLVWVCEGIGTDFIFRDWGLQYEDGGEKLQRAMMQLEKSREVAADWEFRDPELPKPKFPESDPVASWEVDLAETPEVLRGERGAGYEDYFEEEWWRDEPDANYYDDWCHLHDARLSYRYCDQALYDKAFTSWKVGRRIDIPAVALEKAGAYVLTAEANGQTIFVPLLVDPLSLALRRCRDGVLAVVSDMEGKSPLEGARIHAASQQGKPAATDANGVAFAKVAAVGDRALIAHHDGRFAIGGFGRVFRGVYETGYQEHWHGHGMRRIRDLVEYALPMLKKGHVFEDHLVAAAYTDRPIYRPGQELQFKVILRKLAKLSDEEKKPESIPFRAEDFDWGSQLELPDMKKPILYDILDPKGREIHRGEIELNDFGTASGTVNLNPEAAHGIYSLQIHSGGLTHVVPSVFQVEAYRRANFEIVVSGVPEKLARDKSEFAVDMRVSTYYGKPLANLETRVRVLPSDQWQSLAEGVATTGQDGTASVKVALPKSLAPGKYRVISQVTDESGRTVTETHELLRQGESVELAGELPRYAGIGERIQTPSGEMKFDEGGWQQVDLKNGEQHDIFIYGKGVVPSNLEDAPGVPKWVNLADYQNYDLLQAVSEYGERPHAFTPAPVVALLGKRSAEVSSSLELLIHNPYEEPRRVLLSIEGRTVVDYRTITLPPSPDHFSRISIEVTGRHLPNFYLQAFDLSPAARQSDLPEQELHEHGEELEKMQDVGDGSEDPEWCRIDVIDPNALPRGESLSVDVSTDRESYRPGDRARVEVKVTGEDGKARDAEVSLAVVDASVFAYAEGREPLIASQMNGGKPTRRFLPKPWRSSTGKLWSAAWIESPERLEELHKAAEQMQRAQEALQDAMASLSEPALRNWLDTVPRATHLLPVGEIPLDELRSDFRETAAWLPHLRTGPDGTVSTEISLPDNLTRYRLSAVALTRDTEIGSGRSSMVTRLPLSVQLFAPRFFTQGDELEIVALAEREPAKARRPIEFVWEVKDGDGWRKLEGDEDAATKNSQRSRVKLPFPDAGEFTIRVKAGDGTDSDGEERTFQVNPWGRERQLSFRGIIGRPGEPRKIVLPEGITVRSLSATFSRKERIEVTDSLEGLRSLLGFPYGCVEQSMSRFLPAVIARKAVGGSSIDFPEDIEKALPGYIERGLARLYNLQHADGGWGWWEHDATDPRMTAYVVYGLARCRASGVKVDYQVFEKGIGWLKPRIADGSITGGVLSEAWLALAIADAVDRGILETHVHALLENAQARHDDLCFLALTCRYSGMEAEAEKVWNRARVAEPDQVARSLAVRLTTQLAFEAPFAECLATAEELTDLRMGFGWGDTRSTSWAIDGLSQIIPKLPEPEPPGPGEVPTFATLDMDGNMLLDTRKVVRERKAGRESGVVEKRYAKHHEGIMAPAKSLTLASEGDTNFVYTVTIDAVQNHEHLEPVGEDMQIGRSITDIHGVPVSKPVNVGEIVKVSLKLYLEHPAEYVLVESPRPSGFEFADDRLSGGAHGFTSHREFRDDKLAVFFASLPAGDHELTYYLRAETAGRSGILPAVMYPMYDVRNRAESASGALVVKPIEK